jgi:alanyl-tRNA synthetase
LILSEGSIAAGIRRIEAVTGKGAYQMVQSRFQELRSAAQYLSTGSDTVASQTKATLDLLNQVEKSREKLLKRLAIIELNQALEDIQQINGINLLTKYVEDADIDTLRVMADRFRQKISENGVVVIATVIEGTPRMIAAVTNDLIEKGIKAGDLIQFVAKQVGGGGGGRPGLAEAGGKNPEKIQPALESVPEWILNKEK